MGWLVGHIIIDDVCFSYNDSALQERGKHRGKQGKVARKGLLRSCPDVGKPVLNHISLEIPDGQFLYLIGHSGCGKSTLLRLLVGLDRPSSGTLSIDGKTIEQPGLDRSIVFQNYSLFPWMTAQKNIEFGIEQANRELCRGYSKEDISNIAREYLERVEMTAAADKYPYQLSGGMQQRVAIARALSMDTQILLFDEPFGALDVRTRRSLQKLVEDLWDAGQERKTVVFVTHDISEAVLLADRIVFMGHGELLADYTVDIERPRSVDLIQSDANAVSLCSRLTDLFYRESASSGEAEQDAGFDYLEARIDA